MSIISELVLQLSQICGVFPVTLLITHSGNTVLLFSRNFCLWGLSLVVVLASWSCATIVINILNRINDQTKELMSTTYILTVSLVHFTLATMSVALVVCSAQQSKRIINIYRMLKKFDLELRVRSIRAKSNYVICYSFGVLSLAILTFVLHSFINKLSRLQFIPRIFLCYVFCASGVHFHQLCWHLTERIRIINGKIKEEVQMTGLKSSAFRIRGLMDSYWLLMETIEQCNLSYHKQLVFSLYSIFVHIIFTIYNTCDFLAKGHLGTDEIQYLVVQGLWLVTHTSQLILFVAPATGVSNMAKQSAPEICKIINGELNQTVLQQMKRFLIQLLHQKACFSAFGLFTVHLNIFPQMAGMMMTYLVVLLQ